MCLHSYPAHPVTGAFSAYQADTIGKPLDEEQHEALELFARHGKLIATSGMC